MKVLVTGASGFIGSALVPALSAAGHEIRNDIRGCDAVVHLANIAHASVDRTRLWKVNVEGTRRTAEDALAAGVRRFVYLSSIKASGEQTAGKPFDGSEAGMPRDDYGRAKLAAEQALFEVGIEAVALRPPLVYGPRVKGNFLALMKAVARGWPLPFASIVNRRSLIYVGNLADAVINCLEAPRAGGRAYVVGDETLSTPQLCRAIGSALGVRAKLFPFPNSLLGQRLAGSLEVDAGRIQQETGWRPAVGLEEALRRTARWYRAR